MMRTNPTTKAAGRSRRPWRARLAAATVGGLVLTGTTVVGGALPAQAEPTQTPTLNVPIFPVQTIRAPARLQLRATVGSPVGLTGKAVLMLFKPAAKDKPACSGATALRVERQYTADPVSLKGPTVDAFDLNYDIKATDPAGAWEWRLDYSGDALTLPGSTGCLGPAVVEQRGGPVDPDPTDPTPTATRALVTRQFRDFLDRAPLSAELTDWTRRIEEKTATIGDLVASLRGGTDHLQNVDPVVRLYRAYFLRSPDAAGLEYWIDARRDGRSLTSISDFFSQSPEFRTRYGSLDNSAFVDLIYRNILTRPGDERGAAFWKGELDQGLRTRGAVMIGFSESPEYIADQASEVTVSVLYALMLDRAPTSVEFSGTVALLDITDTPRPFTVADLADDLAGKAEY